MKYIEQASCNRCNTQCRGKKYEDERGCERWLSTNGKFMLAELALAHPTSLNEALSALPFEVNLEFFLPKA